MKRELQGIHDKNTWPTRKEAHPALGVGDTQAYDHSATKKKTILYRPLITHFLFRVLCRLYGIIWLVGKKHRMFQNEIVQAMTEEIPHQFSLLCIRQQINVRLSVTAHSPLANRSLLAGLLCAALQIERIRLSRLGPTKSKVLNICL